MAADAFSRADDDASALRAIGKCCVTTFAGSALATATSISGAAHPGRTRHFTSLGRHENVGAGDCFADGVGDLLGSGLATHIRR